jgi:hypothetical protein
VIVLLVSKPSLKLRLSEALCEPLTVTTPVIALGPVISYGVKLKLTVSLPLVTLQLVPDKYPGSSSSHNNILHVGDGHPA